MKKEKAFEILKEELIKSLKTALNKAKKLKKEDIVKDPTSYIISK